jgi:hypothetical protein
MQAHAFKMLQEGQLVQMELDTLKRIEAHPINAEAEVILLRCGPLKVHAFLVLPSGAAPLIFPAAPLPVAQPKDVYTEDEFFTALKPEAARVLQAYTGAGANAGQIAG